MSYLTAAEFREQIMPGDALSGMADDVISTALAWASSQADSYLRKRYKLPVSSPGEDLKLAVGGLAQWQLLSRRGFRPGSGQDEVARDRYEYAIQWLRDVSKGIVEIAGTDQTPDVDEEGTLAASDPPQSFRMNTGRGRRRICDE